MSEPVDLADAAHPISLGSRLAIKYRPAWEAQKGALGKIDLAEARLDRLKRGSNTALFPNHSDPVVINGAISSNLAGPMPETFMTSSMIENGPLSSRKSRIFWAVLGPTPGKVSS